MHGLLVAQALAERGMLDSMVAGITRLRYQLETYIGEGRTTYLLIGAAVVFVFLMLRPRR
jgi:hypothetical protein